MSLATPAIRRTTRMGTAMGTARLPTRAFRITWGRLCRSTCGLGLAMAAAVTAGITAAVIAAVGAAGIADNTPDHIAYANTC
jgi:hypothetical protein